VQWSPRESATEIARRYGFAGASTLGDPGPPPPPSSGGGGAVLAVIVLGAIFVGVIAGERALTRLGG
jgi:hypothetical protein